MVGEPVKKRSRERGIAEDFNPAREVEVGSDAQAPSFIHFGDELKRERSTRLQEKGRLPLPLANEVLIAQDTA